MGPIFGALADWHFYLIIKGLLTQGGQHTSSLAWGHSSLGACCPQAHRNLEHGHFGCVEQSHQGCAGRLGVSNQSAIAVYGGQGQPPHNHMFVSPNTADTEQHGLSNEQAMHLCAK